MSDVMNPAYEPLLEPYTLNNGVRLKNRLVVAPLTIYDSGQDGELTDAARRFWQDCFTGFALFVAPFTNVHPGGIGFPSPNAYDERHLETLAEYARLAHDQGATAVIQLAHCGMRARPALTHGHDVVAPTAVRGVARAMSDTGVRQMVGHVARAAELSPMAGLDGVEIHGANGWLIQQFVSASTNRRTDDWGGDLEGRMRFPPAIIDAIDEVRRCHDRPDFVVGYRFSPEEPGPLGLTMDQTLAFVDRLVDKPLQYLHVSLWDFYKRARHGAPTTRMQALHERIGGQLPLIGVGNLYTAEQILRAYSTGWADLIALGKTVMLNPHLVELIESGRESQIETHFDWARAETYRYTQAMLDGTRAGMDFYPPSVSGSMT